MTVLVQTGRALRRAAVDARRSWDTGAGLLTALFVVALVLPPLLSNELETQRLATGLLLALAAAGLGFTVGLAGLPSLGQGAFMAIGAFGAALARGRAGLDPVSATLVACLAAALVGIPVGMSVVRLRSVFVAVSSWLLAWLVSLTLLSFPEISGGSDGLVVPSGSVLGLQLTPTVFYETALVLLALCVLAFAAVSRGAPGLRLGALRQNPAQAAALGIRPGSVRLGAFAASAAVAGLAGALTVQLAGVADPSDYGPFLSFKLFVAVMLGGATAALGGPTGVGILALVTLAAHALGAAEGVDAARFDPLLAAIILLCVIGLGGDGLIPTLRKTRLGALWARRKVPRRAAEPDLPRGTVLRSDSLSKRFGGVVAADDVDLELVPGTVTALIGPNGSGKTTVLRLLAGTLPPDSGRVILDGSALRFEAPWDAAAHGVVRTLQRTAIFPDLTVLENVLAGGTLHRRYGGAVRTALATPKERAESTVQTQHALGLLEDVQLGQLASAPAYRVTGSDARLLMLATALAARPSVLLLDEIAAGATPGDVDRLTGVLGKIRLRGLTLVLVEHNLELVRSVADRVIVLSSGKIIATGSPDEVAADPNVQDAYLGRSGFA
jgi:branched-chain amino acid transport system ATP-binding protein/branched-chain amino acid transport system permease protein